MLKQLKSVFKRGLAENTEAEVTFGVTQTRFEYILDALHKSDNPVSNEVYLDITYSVDAKTAYRISVDSDLDKFMSRYANTRPAFLFSELHGKGSYTTVEKKRLATNKISGLDLKVSSETMVDSIPTMSKRPRMVLRLKDRYTQVVYDENGFKIQIDITDVATGTTLGSLDDHQYEVEVELTCLQETKSVPDAVLVKFAETLQVVRTLVDVNITKAVSVDKGDNDNASRMTWVPDNKISFLSWLYRTFADPEVAAPHGTCDGSTSSKRTKLFPHQKFIRDYLQFESPYRGLLLFHGLGVGKTCASIAAAEGFVAHHRKVIVMVPASLVVNYKEEILRCASLADPESKAWSLLDLSQNKAVLEDLSISVKLAKKHAYKVWLPYTPETLEDLALRKGVAWKELKTAEQAIALEIIEDIVDNKYKFISYNGLTSKSLTALGKTPFNDAFVVIDEAHNFISRVVHGSKIARSLYEKLMYASGMKIALLTGTPIINHPFELGNALNLVRGPMQQYTISMGAPPAEKDVIQLLRDTDMLRFVDRLHVRDDTIKFTLHPYNFVSSSTSQGIVYSPWSDSINTVRDNIIETIRRKHKAGKKVTEDLYLAYPNNSKEFDELFLDMKDRDNPRVKNMDMFIRRAIGLVSYFKTAGEENFPRVTTRVIERINMSDYQFTEYTKKRSEERTMERSTGLLANRNKVYRAFSRMACNFVFPEDLDRPFPKDLRKAAQREVDAEYSDDEESDQPKKKVKKSDIDAEYESKLSKLMKALAKNSGRMLSEQALTNLYSPKMQFAYNKIKDSPGKVLFYSQFRTIEGLGVMKVILESRGYIEVKVVQSKAGEWKIVNAAEVMKPKYNGKRFITFDTEREKSKVLLQMFNDDPAAPKEVGNKNLRGEFIKVVMITQSGSEGISLKNVRQVVILEPFWNMVRMDQVVGRAVRTCSHHTLPPAERTVDVSILCSVISPEQLKSDFTTRRKDKSMSSDLHILQLAETKDALTQVFLNGLKIASVDCRANAGANGMLDSGFQCYAFPVGSVDTDHSYKLDFDTDKQNLTLARTRKVQGKVVSYQGKKYVVLENDKTKLYDYHAYRHAGVLEPV